MATYQHERLDTPVEQRTAVASSRRFSPGQILGGAAGVLMTIVGIIAVTRTGIDGHLNEPVTDIFGVTHSAYVGLFEIVAGLIITTSAASIAYRGVMGFFGALTIIAGVVLAASSAKILLDVGAKHSTGWFGIVLGAVVVLGSMLPSFLRSDTYVRDEIR